MTLPLKPFHLMTAEDYAALGLRCGLEVHQQLLTERKLFCRCPAGRYSCEHDAEILRHMRPTLSELGEYDGTALMEKKTRKNIYYRIHRDTVCTYEFDDTPPFMLNEQALDVALEIALLLRLNMVNELHVARKQYLDGSIPTGFQRTTIVGVDGWIPYQGRRIGIRQLGLEEDSCREVSDVGHDRVYLTDRLGMPLIETVTEPDMHTPQEAAEVGQIIRMLCRSTGKVRRGYGATRQDVNVSIRGGTRVEIKGVPQLTRLPRLIYNEAMRQYALLQIRDELKSRGVTPETFSSATYDVTHLVAKVQYEPIRAAVEKGWLVKCVALRGFGGLLSRITQEHTTFATEFSDRIRVIACLTQLPNMVQSDSAAEFLAAGDWKHLRKRTQAGNDDVLVLVWGDQRDAQTACEEIAIRAREATVGVPSDTRQALKDGTTGFERVLPGPERMYPDTDLPPMAIDAERVERARATLPPFVWDREARYRALHVPEDVIRPLCMSPRAGLFDRLVDEVGVDPKFAAVVLFQRLKHLQRNGLHPERLGEEDLLQVFRGFADGRLTREGVLLVIQHLLRNPAPAAEPSDRLAAAMNVLTLKPISDTDLAASVSRALAEHPKDRFPAPLQRTHYVTGRLMKGLVGRVAARHVAELVRRQVESATTKSGEKVRA